MQYRIRGYVVALCMASLAVLSGCSEATAVANSESNSGSGGGAPTGVSISQYPQVPLCLTNGSSSYVFYASDNLGGGVSWQSRNEAVASIANVDGPNRALVVGKSAGSTWTVATSTRNASLKDSVQVTVSADCAGSPPPPPTSSPIDFVNPGPFSLNTGDGCSLQFQIVATPNQPLNWTSSNTSKASVSGNGTNVGTVNVVPNSSGSVNITARTLDSAYSKDVTLYLSNVACTSSPPPGGTLNASPSTISLGQSSTLSWSSSNTTSCTASGGWSGTKSVSGSEQVSPSQTTVYTITCTGPGGSVSASVTVTVTSGSNSITMNPPGGSYPVGTVLGVSVTCTVTSGSCNPWWYSENPEIISVNPNTGVLTFLKVGSTNICVQRSQTDASLKVCHMFTSTGTTAPPMLIFFSAEPTSINAGQSSTLSWSSSNTTSCTASGGWSGTKLVSGSQQVSPSQTTVYTITCTGPGGSVAQSVTVTVASAPSPVVTSLVVSPKNSNLLIGQSGTLFATGTTSDGSTMPTPTWVATLGCVQLSSSSGSSVIVTGVRACRDSVVASSGGKKDFAIVTVTSGVSSIDYTPPGGTIAVNATQNLTATCVLAGGVACTPYWYSTDPSRVTVVGAPSQIVIGGVSYPAGQTATIKRLAAGSVQICVQAAVQDQTVLRCYTWN